jgi:hypothetical protein
LLRNKGIWRGGRTARRFGVALRMTMYSASSFVPRAEKRGAKGSPRIEQYVRHGGSMNLNKCNEYDLVPLYRRGPRPFSYHRRESSYLRTALSCYRCPVRSMDGYMVVEDEMVDWEEVEQSKFECGRALRTCTVTTPGAAPPPGRRHCGQIFSTNHRR